jgi:hypothetical protein
VAKDLAAMSLEGSRQGMIGNLENLKRVVEGWHDGGVQVNGFWRHFFIPDLKRAVSELDGVIP